MLYIYPYKNGLSSIKNITALERCLIIKRENSRFVHKPGRVVINWGCSELCDRIDPERVLNHPEAVKRASNKLLSFETFEEKDVPSPKYTTDIEVAKEWLGKEGRCVFARKLLRGHAGGGIVACTTPDEVPKAPLYTRYIRKKDEYRVHVMRGQILDVQRKMAKEGVDVDWRIRTGSNGFVFGREGVNPDEKVLRAAAQAVEALGLDFAGVDVMWQEASEKAFVLECNTGPGIEGSTVGAYVRTFKEVLR